MPRLRSGRLATLVTAALILTVTPVITAGPASATVPNPVLNCQPETHPAAGTPRNSPGAPYQAPFAANLDGGYLAIHVPDHLGVTFGIPEPGYPNGTLFGEACGRFGLPSLSGSITDPLPGAGSALDNNPHYNHNFILHGPTPGATPPLPAFPVCDLRYTTYTALNPTISHCDVNAPVPVGITLQGTGLPVLDGYGSADGVINAAIVSQAANGGLNVTFSNTAKATAVLDPGQLLNVFGNIATSVLSSLSPALQSLLGQLETGLQQAAGAAQGGECTLAVGDLSQTGLPGAPVTPPVHLTTVNPSPNGSPVTGPVSAGIKPINPITAGSALAYANDFPAAAIDPNMPPDPGAPNAGTTPPSTLCNPVVAQLFNIALGLPAPAGDVTFRAPVGFSAHAPY
jgi:hypothetical protein